MDKFLNINYKLQPKEYVDVFVLNYHHINYCEIIIEKDGSIRQCIPSHQETLRSLMRYQTNNENWEAPEQYWCDYFNFMLNETGVIAVWYDNYKIGTKCKPTKQQLRTIKILNEHNKINFKIELEEN